MNGSGKTGRTGLNPALIVVEAFIPTQLSSSSATFRLRKKLKIGYSTVLGSSETMSRDDIFTLERYICKIKNHTGFSKKLFVSRNGDFIYFIQLLAVL